MKVIIPWFRNKSNKISYTRFYGLDLATDIVIVKEMQSFYDDRQYVLVLEKGDSLFEKLQEFVNEHSFKGAWLQGLGAALDLELGYYDLAAQEYHWKQFAGIYEITGLQGNIVLDSAGKPLFHLHGTFSDQNYHVIGGHVRQLTVGGTCELFIKEVAMDMSRTHDAQTGLNLLCKA
jgi:predicted DNA-binding protein with PD1-like motif